MRWFDNVIVGSGAAGVAAALMLNRRGTAMVDVGCTPPAQLGWDNLSQAKEAGRLAEILGEHWEGLANLYRPELHDKLKAPLLRYVASGEPFRVLDADGVETNKGQGSYARGGLANAWGAQVYRYLEQDLAPMGDWPIRADELTPFYDLLEDHIGIAGDLDDLQAYFGAAGRLLPGLPLVASARAVFDAYTRNKAPLQRLGITFGRPRLAVLSEAYKTYAAHHFGETEFFDSLAPGIYTPQRGLNEVLSQGQVEYLGGLRVERYEETNDGVRITARDVASNDKVVIGAKTLYLGCGTLHTARLVLLANNARGVHLPIMDHPPALVPVVVPGALGQVLPRSSFPNQLAATFVHDGEHQLVSVYYPGGILRTDLLGDLPFDLRSNRWFLNRLLSGLLVLQAWQTARPHTAKRLSLDGSGAIVLQYGHRPPNAGLTTLLRGMRHLGAYGHAHFNREAPAGWGFHYAGTLPMRIRPDAFETDVQGRLWNCKRVFVLDGALLPSLPAKNLTFTIMANSARVATLAGGRN